MNHYKFEEIEVGMEVSFTYELNEEKMKKFKEISGDLNPLHNDLDYAKSKGYNDKVVYGLLTSSVLSTLAGMYIPGEYSLIESININYIKPVYIIDSPLTIQAKVKEKEERFKQITLKYSIYNKKKEKVSRGDMKIGFTNEK